MARGTKVGGQMARPKKEGLDYFPLDIDIDQDDKIAVIEAKYGIVGFAIVIKLLMRIYKNGYFYHWIEDNQILFANKVNMSVKKINEIVDDCAKRNFFNMNMLESYEILTSKGIQKRYLEAAKRRQIINIKPEYILLSNEEICVYKNLSNVDIDIVNANNNLVNVNINPQSKVKKSKVKNKYGEFVTMTKKEYEKLINEYGEELTQKMVKKLDNYKGSTGKKYRSDYRAILSWVVDKVMEEQKKKTPETNYNWRESNKRI